MAANQMGVDLDLAQATNAKVPGAAKKVTEHSLAGGSKFAENTEANLRALHEHAQNLQDAIAPQMDRMEFGDQAKQALVQHVSKLNDRASELYEGLDDRLSDIKPNPSDIQEAAKKIVSENKDYYDKHPDLLKGAPAKAWAIINDLAGEKAGKPQTIKYWDNPDATSPTTEIIPAKVKPPDTWSDLHRLRSDLLDIYRGPEFVGDRPTGWLKQMVSAIDQTMNDGARTPGMTPADQKDFRAANSIYERMKKTYDDPRSPFYYMTRQDGSQVADALNRMRPEDAMRFREAMDDTGNGHLSGQLERQAVNRLLDPAGNGVPDLKNFASRWGRAQKETAGGILQPQTMQDLNDLASVARTVHQDVNPSGTGKLLQPVSEATGVISGTIGALAAGHPAVAAVPAATMLAERGIASAMTNPKVVGEAMMHTAPEPLLTTAKGIAADIDPRTATAKAAAIEAGNQPPNQSSDQQNTRDRWRTVNGQRIDTSPARIEGVSTPPNEGQVASVEGAEPNEVHQANIPERRVPEPAPAPPPLPEAAPTKTPRAQIEVGASSANAMPQGATHEVWDQAGKQLLGHVVNGEYVPLEQQ